jgi:hypothetical protein
MELRTTARLVRAALLAAVVLVLLALSVPRAAVASEFAINACQADRANYSTQAFDDFATRGMMWKRACDPEGPGLRGLLTSNVPRPGRVPRGSRSYFVMRAPEGTRFARFTWSGQARRRDCRYALQLWASRPDGAPTPIRNVRANTRCPRRNYAQAAGWPRPRTYDINGATRIVQRVICVGEKNGPHCSSRGLNYIRTFKAQATVVDVSPPAVSVLQDNPFTQGQWVRGVQTVNYTASDNVGVKKARAIVSGGAWGEHHRPCDYAARVPCVNGGGAITFDTRVLLDGSQHLTVDALDAADNLAASTPVTVRVDNTAPGAVAVDVVGGTTWRNENRFTAFWANPSEGDRAPIAAARYQICRPGGGQCTEARRPGPDISSLSDLGVPEPGEWQLRVWREDAAGNHESANASVPVPLMFDPEPPQLAFERVSSSDPTLVSVAVSDRVSGVIRGQIELSRQGSGLWQSLATQLSGNRLTARIDDSLLPAGVYLLRATAWDQASNQNSTDQTTSGEPMIVTLPLRVPTALQAGVKTERTVRRSIGRGKKRRTVRRRVVELRPRAEVRYGERIVIAGKLENRDGQPVPGAEIQVYSGSPIDRGQLIGVVNTDTAGAFTYQALADATRTLRFVYAGAPVMLPSEAEVGLLTSAGSTLRAKPRRLKNGQSVQFFGRLRSLPAPPAGKLVELQVVLSGRWQTFRTTRTEADGKWAIRYHFRRTCGVLRYRFRARLPAEAGYAFQTGYTRPLTVTVRGPRCR